MSSPELSHSQPEESLNARAREDVQDALNQAFPPLPYELFPNPGYLLPSPQEQQAFKEKEVQVRKGYR